MLLEVQLNRAGANRAQVNRGAIKPRELPRYVASVLFAPEDLALVRGEPSGRRRFLDQLLVQLTPRLAGVLADYDRVLRQRNTLLKSARAPRSARDAALHARDLGRATRRPRARRSSMARRPRRRDSEPPVRTAYRVRRGRRRTGADRSTGARSASLGRRARRRRIRQVDDDPRPDPHPPTSTDARRGHSGCSGERSPASAGQRLDRGLTLVGPHRDDLVLGLNGLPARGYASHGESWSFALALKLASAALLRAESPRGDPVLDPRRRLRRARRGAPRAAGGGGRRLRAGAHHRRGARRRPERARGAHVVRIRARPYRRERAERSTPIERGRAGPEHIAVYRRLRRVFGDPGPTSVDRIAPSSAASRRRATRRRAVRAGPRPDGASATCSTSLTAQLGWDSPLGAVGTARRRGPRSSARRPRRTPRRSASRTAC